MEGLNVKMNRKFYVILLLIIANIAVIYDLINAIFSGVNIWFPILIITLEIITIVIYSYIGQYGDKIKSVDHNPNYGN
jgi:hypothetical protein